MSKTDADDWIFAFKLNGHDFPTPPPHDCLFRGTPQHKAASQEYAYARASSSALVEGGGLIGTSLTDPVGATFDEIYNGNLNFVVWNDQFYDHPKITGCCSSPWGHSKGVIAWDNAGNGVVMQVSTPSWPGSGTAAKPRQGSGNTLGCIVKPNDIFNSQHFFELKLTPSDTAAVLEAMANASVPTDITNAQLARIGGPQDIQDRARQLGRRSQSTTPTDVTLSTGVRLISKPSNLHVPPWQFVSAKLGGVGLRAATWWKDSRIPTTDPGRLITCWRSDLGQPGRVEIALTGHWKYKDFGLRGGINHAKIGVSLDATRPYVIFGDMNQEGRLTASCGSSQNGRGGLFFVVQDLQLHAFVAHLIAGETAGTEIPGTTP
jgi:hypothetical protein